MKVSRRVIVCTGLAVCLLVGGVAACWSWFVRLSADEWQMVGAWRFQFPPGPDHPAGITAVWQFRPDRSYQIDGTDNMTKQYFGGEPRHKGWWRVEGHRVICKW